MTLLKKAAHYFARKEYCRKVIAEQADLSVFKERPSWRVISGLFLIAFSYAIGLPTAVGLSVFAVSQGKAMLAAVAAPLLYGVSWVMFIAGIYLAGPEYGQAFSRWLTRITLEKILGDKARYSYSLPPEEVGSQQL